MDFIDYIKIVCRSGKGGAGSAHLRRDKLTSKGGPDGGDGGRGGHVILRGNRNMWTLLHLRYQKHLFAGDGEAGGKSRSTGATGKDVVIDVPLGTVARPTEDSKLPHREVITDGEDQVLLCGGKGGLGNWHFKSSVRQTPTYAQKGESGHEAQFALELKILADVGLVGFPNAGKSTLLATVSEATPKIADYPFTTLVPQVGIVQYKKEHSFAMADIPGIIKNAHRGKGLGLRFLRHIERNAVLLFLIPADADDIVLSYQTLLRELQLYNPSLLEKKRFVAVSKIDLFDEVMKQELISTLQFDVPYYLISAVSGEGIGELKEELFQTIEQNREFYRV